MASSRLLAADIGASHVACGVFAAGPGGTLTLQQFALETHLADPTQEAQWGAGTAAALAAAARREKLAGPVSLGVPGHLALTKFIKTPAVEKSKRARILQFEASQNIPYPLEEVVWAPLVVSEEGVDLEVMLAAAKADAMTELCSGAQAAGLAASRAIPGCLALWRGFRYNHPDAAGSLLLVDVGARSTHLLFLEPGRFFVRTLALAGNAVTQAIADDLRLEFAAAEALKLQVLGGRVELAADSPARAAVLRAADNFCARLQLEITRSTVNVRRQTGGEPPAGVYLTGAGTLIPALPATLAAKLKLPVERYDPLRRVECGPRAGAARTDAAALGVLVGLAVPLVEKNQPEASLLPPTLGAELAFRRRQPWLLAAVALLVFALLPPIVHFHRVAAQAQADIAAMDAQLRPVRSLQTRNADNLARIEDARKEIAALHGLVETKANWINFLADLQQRLVQVEDVWLEKLAVVRTAAPSASAPPTGDDGKPAAPALHLTLTGRLLDRKNPVSKVSADSYARVKRLLASFTGSRFIASVENERFDNSQPGILRFDFTLVVNPQNPL